MPIALRSATLTLALAASAAAAGAQRTGQVQRPVKEIERPTTQQITVTATQSGPAEVTVRWTAVPGATSYFIGRHAPPGGWQRVNSPTPTATSYVDRNVEIGRSYTYQVSAIVGDRAGPRFNSDSLVVQAGVVEGAGGGQVAEVVPAESREEMLQRVYSAGLRANDWWQRGANRGRRFWMETANVSGFDEATLRSRWRELAIAAQLYQHIFYRAPTKIELDRQLAAQRAGVSADDQWRTLAQSAAREREHKIFAPAPMTMSQAQGLFGWRYPRPGEQCYGGLGPGCTGTIPAVFEWVQPKWQQHFMLPDGTEMAYVEIGVAVGSIMHDAACMDGPAGGVACSGWEAITDITKHSGVPAAKEWNKAAWNVMDGRGWRHTFGPYPVDLALRRKWYDDMRPAPGRGGYMAEVAGILTLPIHDVRYAGREKRASAVLFAPSGTTLDGRDAAYCSAKKFKRTESPIGKAMAGICW